MKRALTRALSLLLVALFVCGMGIFSAFSLAGDVNGDNEITIFDVMVILKAVANGNKNEKYDVNGDGNVNLLDIVKALKIIASGDVPEVGEEDKTSADVVVENGTVKEAVSINGDKVSAAVPEGVAVDNGTTSLTLSVTAMDNTNGNITTEETEDVVSYDVHIDGVSKDNTVAIIVDLGAVLPVGQNFGTVALYHVENGETVKMTQVMTLAELDAHNEFYYYPETGNVYVALATFSEIAIVADNVNAWEGNFDYSWYTEPKTVADGDADYTIANADQLAAFGAIVGGMAKDADGNYIYTNPEDENDHSDSFAGKTVKLIADINLGDKESENTSLIFHPIGYYYTDDKNGDGTKGDYYSVVKAFEGTFDGAGHTIANFYQNTWEIKGDYDGNYYNYAMGLFGYVYCGTVKNLTVDNFSSDGEYATTGVIAAYGVNSTFENIAITNCNPRVYNTGNGGIVGIGGLNDDTEAFKLTFTNITIDNTNKISALWGSWDVACGGLVGMFRGAGHAHMTNCHVAAQIDVYNDVCGNYQYYWYRYAGMMIGTNKNMVTDEDGYTVPDTSKFHAKDCTVHFGNWNDYYYCELVANSLASYTHDHQFSRLTQIESLDEIKSGDTWTKTGNFLLISGDTKTCYHIVKNADGTLKQHLHTDAGEEVVNGETVLKENNQIVYLPFNQLFTGYGWGVKHIPVYNGEDYAFEGITILDREVANSVEKFDGIADGATFTTETTVTIGELFKAIDGVEVAIDTDNIMVAVSPADKDSTVSGIYVADTTDWTKGTLTFSGIGAATITIQDYYFCIPTTITVNVEEPQPEEKFDVVMNNGDFLHRVGNIGTVALNKLFKEKDGVTVGTVSVTVEAVNGTNASGTYSNNAIQFSGTGVVKVTITDNDYCIPTELYLEVVDATNVTTATDATEGNIVLLNDIGSGFTVSGRYTVYGNGFTLNYTGNGQYLNNGLKQGVVTVSENGTLDNLRIKATIYPRAYLYYGETTLGDYVQGGPSSVEGDKTRYHYQLSAVAARGNATISNCYIYGGRTNIFVDTGDVTVKDTILECGTVANVQIQSNSSHTVTLEDVTTIQYQVNPTMGDTSKVMLGTAILVGPDNTSNPTIVLNGNFKQYNWVTAADADAVSDSVAKSIINGTLNATAYNHTVNGKTASNLGIIYMNEEDAPVKNNTGLPYKLGDVSMSGINGKAYSLQNATAGQIYSDCENADRSTVNGDYMPTFDFDLGNQEISYDGSEDTRYLYGDANGVIALYQDGDAALTLDLSKIATIYKYSGCNYTYTAVCKDSDDKALTATNNVVTLSAQGNYTLEFTVEDYLFYDKDGNAIVKSIKRTFTVPLTLTVKEANVKNAVVNITKTALDGVYNTVNLNDYELRIKFLDCISITDYDNRGNGTTVNLSSNISSATLTPSGVNVFTTASTITITYTDGRVLTVNLSKISGSSPGTKTAKINTSGSVYFTTEGALNNKPTESSSQNKCTITSVSFKGNSGSTVTNDTDVTVTWALESSGSGGGCVTPDTLVTLADGTQVRVDALTGNEELLVWNLETGRLDSAEIMFVDRDPAIECDIVTLYFSDGTSVKVIYEHGFFDYDLGRYVYLDENASEYIGHTFAKQNGDILEKVTLTDVVIETEVTEAWSPVTKGHLCYFVNGMLSMPGGVGGLFNIFDVDVDTMTYDFESIAADIEEYGLFTYEELNAIEPLSEDMFNEAGGAYLKISIGKGNLTMDELVAMIRRYSKFF